MSSIERGAGQALSLKARAWLVRRKPHLRLAAELVLSRSSLEQDFGQSSPPAFTGRVGSATAEHNQSLMPLQQPALRWGEGVWKSRGRELWQVVSRPLRRSRLRFLPSLRGEGVGGYIEEISRIAILPAELDRSSRVA